MLLGAHLAGTAIENSMLGAAHATANPLTAPLPPLTHGRAVALMLPHVIRLNGQVVDNLYGELCVDIQLNGSTSALAAQSRRLVRYGRTTASARRLSGRRKQSTRHGPRRRRRPMDRDLQPASSARSGFPATLRDGVLMGEGIETWHDHMV